MVVKVIMLRWAGNVVTIKETINPSVIFVRNLVKTPIWKTGVKVSGRYVIPWSEVLEKPVNTYLVKKFVAFCGIRRFITMFTRACQRTMS
jgi:hypothetical protein